MMGDKKDKKDKKERKWEKKAKDHRNIQTRESRRRELEAEIKRLQTMLVIIDKSEQTSVVFDDTQQEKQWDDGVVYQNSSKYPELIAQEGDNHVDCDERYKLSSTVQNHHGEKINSENRTTTFETEISISSGESESTWRMSNTTPLQSECLAPSLPSWKDHDESNLLEQCQENSTKTQRNYETGPFAPREGKTLYWRHVNMTLIAKGSKGLQKKKAEAG